MPRFITEARSSCEADLVVNLKAKACCAMLTGRGRGGGGVPTFPRY